MVASSGTFRFYRRRMQAEFQEGGQGRAWMDRLKLAMHTASVAAAPSRTNTLKASHRSFTRGINQWACEVYVLNVAEHAEWVHEGTDWIEGTMRVPRARGPIRGANLPRRAVFYTDGRGKNATGVSGQDANPWLDRACTAIAIANGAVRVG